MAFAMNKQREAHLSGAEGGGEGGGAHAKPHIFIHSHSAGHTVHVHHPDGGHTKHEHAHGDTEGIKAHIDKHLGGAPGNVASEGGPAPQEEEEFS